MPRTSKFAIIAGGSVLCVAIVLCLAPVTSLKAAIWPAATTRQAAAASLAGAPATSGLLPAAPGQVTQPSEGLVLSAVKKAGVKFILEFSAARLAHGLHLAHVAHVQLLTELVQERRAAATQAASRSQNSASPSSSGTSGSPAAPATTAASGSPQEIAQHILDTEGQGSQFSCLNALWTRESGWNPYATNPGSGAYGIPQALPGSKMASAGPDWRTNPATQIRWGLSYIDSQYGSPCGAWAHEQADGWY
jgi:hypothetical protein